MQAFFVLKSEESFDHQPLAPSLSSNAFENDKVGPGTECVSMKKVRLRSRRKRSLMHDGYLFAESVVNG